MGFRSKPGRSEPARPEIEMLELVCVLLATERMPQPAASPTIRELADLVASAEVIYVDDTHTRIRAEGEVIVLGSITSCNLGNCVESDGIHLVERDARSLIRPERLVFDARILQDDEEV